MVLDAVKPVKWALSAAKSIHAEVFDPVINTVLKTTGFSHLMKTLSVGIEDLLQPVLAFRDGLQNVVRDMKNCNVTGVVDDV